jgi:hypothetical protein
LADSKRNGGVAGDTPEVAAVAEVVEPIRAESMHFLVNYMRLVWYTFTLMFSRRI